MKHLFEKTFWETPFSCERGGLTIRGKAMIPKQQREEKLTPVIVSHGFMANMQTTAGYCRKLASWGFAAFCFDFPGGCIKGSSDGKTTEMSVFTEAEDLEAVIGYVSSLGNVDSSKLILMGCSQGGFVSAIVAAKLKEKVARLILFYPALCIPDDARAGKMMMATFDPQNIPEIVNCGPMKLGRIYPASVIDKDPNELIQDYQGPVTIIHGDADPIVKLSYSESAMAAYQAHRDTKGLKLPHADAQLFVIRGAGHGFKGEEDKLAMEIVKQVLHNRFCALEVEVELTGHELKKKDGKRYLTLPFKGNAVGPYFKGVIQEGAADEQERGGLASEKLIHACADYVIQGEDFTGESCEMHIINRNDGKKWVPEVHTDSKVMDFINHSQGRTVFEGRKIGPVIRIFYRAEERKPL